MEQELWKRRETEHWQDLWLQGRDAEGSSQDHMWSGAGAGAEADAGVGAGAGAGVDEAVVGGAVVEVQSAEVAAQGVRGRGT